MQLPSFFLTLALSPFLVPGLISSAAAQGQELEELAAKLSPGDRPGADQGPTQVRVGIFLMDVVRVLEVEQTIQVDFLVEVRWHDPRLALTQSDPGHGEVRKRGLDEVWNPMIQVQNAVRIFPQLPQHIIVDGEGQCVYVQRFAGALSCRFDLHRFPFDSQALLVQLFSLYHTPDDVAFTIDELAGRSETLTAMEWRFGEASIDLRPFSFRPGGLEMAGVRLSVPARRHTGHYVMKVITPLVVIIIMSWSVFWIDPVHIPPKITLAATSLLTMIAYRFALGNMVPKVAYFTRLDVFTFGATLLVLLALVQSLASAWLVQRERPEAARRLNKWCRGLAPLVTLGLLWYSFG